MKLYSVIILSTISLLSGIYLPARAQNISGVVNTYHRVTAINTTTNTLTLSSAAGLSPSVKVLVIQMKGATIDNSNSASFGNITAIGNAGNYEFNYVCSVNGNQVMLVYDLLRTYTVGGQVQLVSVPQYTSATVVDTLKAAPWDSTAGTGGIIAIEATTLTLNAPIDASGMGFKGGVYVDHPQPPYNCDFATNITAFGFANPASGYQTGGTKGEGITVNTASIGFGKGKLANGGGGANNHNSGGAGGSNYGTGGGGGQRSNEGNFNCHGANPGVGGLSLSSFGYSAANRRVFMGGGGGAGHGNNNVGQNGGDGGGIVFIKATTLYGNNYSILANGARPYRAILTTMLGDPYTAGGDGGGGGGGGGVIVYDVQELALGSNVILRVDGANGSNSSFGPGTGCYGPGGGGGGGVIWTRDPAFVPEVLINYSGGTNGVISPAANTTACRGFANGATPGNIGGAAFNYVPPASTDLVCAPLPLRELLYLEGKEIPNAVELNWKMRRVDSIHAYEVERSIDKVSFTNIAAIENDGQYNLSTLDKDAPGGYIYYRLRVLYNDGSSAYSQVITVHLKNNSFQLLRISPNPAKENLTLKITSDKQAAARITIYNGTGQKVKTLPFVLRKGMNQLNVDVQALPAGSYFIVIDQGGEKIVRSFLK